MLSDLPADIVELAPCPPAGPGNPLREMAFRANAWLPEEDEQLRAMFAADASKEEIASALGRRFQAVRARICEVGLRRNSCRPWSELEDKHMMLVYGTEPAASIALHLGRSPSAVYARASILGLSQDGNPDYTPWEDAQLRAGFDQGVPISQIAAFLGRTVKSVSTRAHKALGFTHACAPAGWSPGELVRTLELAHDGHEYPAIAVMLAAEGWPPRSGRAVGLTLRRLGYQRGWGRPWTAEEDELVRRAYRDGDSLTPLKAGLGRGMCSIRWRAGELGLRGTHKNKAGWRTEPPWTSAEEDKLRRLYGTMRNEDLAREFGRSKGSISTRANVLGLKHPWMRAFTPDEDRAIEIVWRRGLSMVDLSEVMGRDAAVVGKHAAMIGFRFSDPNRPVRGPRGARKNRPKLTLEQILALESAEPPAAANVIPIGGGGEPCQPRQQLAISPRPLRSGVGSSNQGEEIAA